jgi:hypothetical protein
MIARPENIPASGSSSPDVSGAETPLQRQIILWQHELLRRAERRRASVLGAEACQLRNAAGEPEPGE